MSQRVTVITGASGVLGRAVADAALARGDMAEADFSTWVQPSELASAILFLASDAASGVTGALLPVRGRV